MMTFKHISIFFYVIMLTLLCFVVEKYILEFISLQSSLGI